MIKRIIRYLEIGREIIRKNRFKELIGICKQDYDEDVIGNCDHYFYLPELTAFYFNNDPNNIINYFTYILFPLYLLKRNYIKIKS